PCDPRAARTAKIFHAPAVVDIRHAHGERRRRRACRSLARQPFYIEGEVVRSKSETPDLRRKCELIAACEQILVSVTGEQRLPGLVETQMHRRLGMRRRGKLIFHGLSSKWLVTATRDGNLAILAIFAPPRGFRYLPAT